MARKPASRWLSPKEVLEIAQRALGAEAPKVIIDRLKGNFLQAVAQRWSDATYGSEPQVSDQTSPIPAQFWEHLQEEASFWNIGDARFFFYDSIYPSRTVRFSGIQFLRVQ